MIKYIDAIRLVQLNLLKKNKKNLVIGIEVIYDRLNFKKKYPKQVFEMPVSELALSGFAVGIASQGYRPVVHHGRVEFAMLAFDQIFTQASKWNAMFGGNYPCPVTFKILVGRKYGDGPQHTANYHSIFLQSSGLNVFIPSTPQEACDKMISSNSSDHPSVILEHRRLAFTSQTVNFKNKIINYKAQVYGNKKDILLLTYGDGIIDCLKAKTELKKYNINITIISLSHFCFNDKMNKNLINELNKYKNIILFESSSFEFGLLNSVIGQFKLLYNSNLANIINISPQNTPCPSSWILSENYYPSYIDIIKKILKLKKINNYKNLKRSFEYVHSFPDLDFDKYNVDKQIF
jgi:pyruvate/2-oxoglutarate/acetoin dehydrogenase E1 component